MYFCLGYLVYVFLDRAHERGGRISMAFRRFPLWYWMRDFFPTKLVKTVDLDPKKTYIFGYHPHGIIALGAWINFATEAEGFSKKFPGVKLRLLTLQSNFNLPIYRDLLICPGNSCMIVVGGAAEALGAHPNTYDLVLKKRLGFVKLALQHGASLVPVFSFGENDIWDQVNNPPGSRVRHMQLLFQKYMSFSPPLFFGRGVFNYSFGLLPYRRPIVSVVGTPIDCPKTEKPSQELVLEYHKKYMDGLAAVFHEHKDKYAPKRERDLEFVE
ncbi:Diacylglycerol O-acyltransferase 2 [Borealophlyctis nickersoniae]|nr:Diacylglycerol O-acyltransferase 2 [Borealophlyctis nickersoniae]